MYEKSSRDHPAMSPDRINAALEHAGVLFALLNLKILVEDLGVVRGVSIIAIVFFTLWGFWNLYYYRHLNQKESAFAAFGLVIANCAWLITFTLFQFQLI